MLNNKWAVQGLLRDGDDSEAPAVTDPELAILDAEPKADDKVDDDEDKDDDASDTDEPKDDESTDDDDKASDDGDEEVKDDDKDDDTDDGEALTRVDYSKMKEALKDNPELLKALKTQFFREQKFTELFPTVEDAQTALNDAQKFETFRDMVVGGDTDNFVKQISEAGALEDFSQNLIGSLETLAPKTYEKITTPIIRAVFWQIAEYGKEMGGDIGANIINAAKVAHHAVFRNYDLGKPEERKAAASDPKLDAERNELHKERYDALSGSINTEINSELETEIEKGLDPTNSLPAGSKKLLAKEIKSELFKRLDADKAHMDRMLSLWTRERKNGFKGQLKDSIKTTFLSRAKTLIPVIRKELRADYFSTQKDKDKKVRDKLANRPKVVPAGQRQSSAPKAITVKEARKKGMSEMDILNS